MHQALPIWPTFCAPNLCLDCPRTCTAFLTLWTRLMCNLSPGQSPTALVTLSDSSHTSSRYSSLPSASLLLLYRLLLLHGLRMLEVHAMLPVYCQLVHPKTEKSYSHNSTQRVHLNSGMGTPRAGQESWVLYTVKTKSFSSSMQWGEAVVMVEKHEGWRFTLLTCSHVSQPVAQRLAED